VALAGSLRSYFTSHIPREVQVNNHIAMQFECIFASQDWHAFGDIRSSYEAVQCFDVSTRVNQRVTRALPHRRMEVWKYDSFMYSNGM